MLFVQTAAPTGWTKSTTHNDKALRVVSGTVSSGGSTAFSTALGTPALSGSTGSTTLSTAQIPSHTHAALNGGATRFMPSDSGSGFRQNSGTTSGAAGGGGSHDHTLSGTATINVQYVDVIIATKG
jgi:hypothetical protein